MRHSSNLGEEEVEEGGAQEGTALDEEGESEEEAREAKEVRVTDEAEQAQEAEEAEQENDVEGRQLTERLLRNERETRFLRKDSNDRKVFEEVFDQPTLLVVYDLLNQGVITELNGVVSAGKEARVYWGVGPDGKPRAVKIYLTASAEFKKRMRYIAGDKRFGKIPHTTRGLIGVWVQKEFKNLQTAEQAGIRVPKPYDYKENVLVMEYIGVPPASAPIFGEAEVNERDYRWTFNTVKKLYRKASLVHADLSEYNIFKYKGRCILFDMGSAVDVGHPEAETFLLRDLTNMVRFFRRRGIYQSTPEELMAAIVK